MDTRDDAHKNWREVKYAEVFEEETRGLERRRAGDPRCRIEELEGTLKHLYLLEGQDWGGRGEVQEISLQASIAAYELVIAELRAAPGVE